MAGSGPPLVVHMIDCRSVVQPDKDMPFFQKREEVPEGQVYGTQLRHIYVLELQVPLTVLSFLTVPQPERGAPVTTTF